MKRQEITITIANQLDESNSQLKVTLFPKRKLKARKDKHEQKITNEIDILELRFIDRDKNELPIQMTPDEALEVAALLNTAVVFYLREFNKEYRKEFTLKIKNLDARRKQLKKKDR